MRHSSSAMPLSKEEKARRRALSAIQAGRHFHARGSANKALLDGIRAEASTGPPVPASSSRKRVRVEQIEAMPAAPAPAAALSDEDEEEEEEEEAPVRPEATKPVAQAPAESFETVLAKRAAQALAKQIGRARAAASAAILVPRQRVSVLQQLRGVQVSAARHAEDPG